MSSPAAGSISGLDRFQALWRRCLLPGATDLSAKIHQRLIDGYGEPQRHYHTLAHIEHCLGMFEQCRSLLANPDAVELSIWFHDVIYEPGAADNEARSAELYQQLAAGVQADSLRQIVDDLIMATLHDGGPIEDRDTAFMVDIDLSSFGLPWEQFLRDSKNLRLENSSVSDEEFYRRANSFQTHLLARERFYYSDFFYRRLENQARQNLSDYADYLRKQA